MSVTLTELEEFERWTAVETRGNIAISSGIRGLVMDSTSVSLLKRLREPNDEIAWKRFVDLYAPLIFHWGKDRGLTATDAAELVQEVLSKLVRKMADFRYDKQKRFRGWLRTITVNQANDLHRRNAVRSAMSLQQTVLLTTANRDLFEEEEYQSYVVGRAVALMRVEFEEQTWQAAMAFVKEGRSAEQVGQQFGMSPNAVRIAKCRVLRRLREELAGLIE